MCVCGGKGRVYVRARPRRVTLTLANGPVGFKEVGLEVDLKQVSSDALHGVVDGENVDPLPVLHIWTWLDTAAHTDTQEPLL